jgi:UDP-N-acetylglucosamine 1-carboxyvinyltransferase
VDKFVINGGAKLKGKVVISGSKNAGLALMPAAILGGGLSVLENVPHLRDITTMGKLLEVMGISVEMKGNTLSIDTSNVNKFEAPYEHVKKMRASIYVLGPLVARYGYAKVSLPGGCAWGPRPVNLHIEGIRKLGANIEIREGYIIARTKKLHGAHIAFDVSSVGATGNIMMAAVLARGKTIIENAAIEPEIVALSEFLTKMGAYIKGIGTTRLEIEGIDSLHPANDVLIPDRIEAGTFLAAAAITHGTITILNVNPLHLSAVISKLESTGAELTIAENSVTIKGPKNILPVDVTTSVYPGFPTDMQAQWMALMTIAKGSSVISDSIYLDRFKHVAELARLGANIELIKNSAVVKGVKKLTGAKVMSTDLRASASLVLAGLVAEGTTEVLRVYHLDRGYESLEKKLKSLGADIKRVAGKEY